MLAGPSFSQRTPSNRYPSTDIPDEDEEEEEQVAPIGVKRVITSYVPDAGTMTLTYQKKMIDGILSLEGIMVLNSLEFFNDDDYEIRMAMEWGLENEFYKDRS